MLLKLVRFICAILGLISYTFVCLPIISLLDYIMKEHSNISVDFYNLMFKWLLFRDE